MQYEGFQWEQLTGNIKFASKVHLGMDMFTPKHFLARMFPQLNLFCHDIAEAEADDGSGRC